MKETSSMQQRRGDDCPQNVCELAVMSRAPGNRRDGVKLDVRSPYNLIPSTEKRRFGAVSHVPVPKDKLMKPGKRSSIITE